MLQLMAGAERLCYISEWGRELTSYFQMGRKMKKVGNHCTRLLAKFDWVLGRAWPIRLFWADTNVFIF